MGIQLTKIDDKADGFTVEFTVINKYRQTFTARPPNIDQLTYARDNVQSIVTGPVEKPEGIEIVPQPVEVIPTNVVHDLGKPVVNINTAGMSDELRRALAL